MNTQEAYALFSRSGLDKPILSCIWRISDVGGDNKLNKVLHVLRANKVARSSCINNYAILFLFIGGILLGNASHFMRIKEIPSCTAESPPRAFCGCRTCSRCFSHRGESGFSTISSCFYWPRHTSITVS